MAWFWFECIHNNIVYSTTFSNFILEIFKYLYSTLASSTGATARSYHSQSYYTSTTPLLELVPLESGNESQ